MQFKTGDIIEILGSSNEGLLLAAFAEPNMTFQIGDFGVVEELLNMSSFAMCGTLGRRTWIC